MTRLVAEGIGVRIDGAAIVTGAALSASAGELVGLIGPNGAGKTTLLRAVAGLAPHDGAVRLDGRPASALSRRAFARAVAYLPQGHGVHWPLTVRRLVALGRLPHLLPWQRPGPADATAIDGAMARTDIAHLGGRNVQTLSGGERARVLLARVLAVEAPVLLADEPIAALDPYHQLHVMALLRATADAGAAIVAVLHDLTLAARYCDRLVLMNAGRVVAEGDAATVLDETNLRAAYRLAALYGEHEGSPYVLPWRRLPSEGPDGGAT
ncbi:MAG: ABC transporter ATP-binding protein [Alphaproteobacteria bacterium]